MRAAIDLRTMCIADTSDYGIVRIIADDPDRAQQVLRQAGQTASVRKVNAFSVPDVPGGLAGALSAIEKNGVNIEYLYALVTTSDKEAYTVMRTDDTQKADEILKESGFKLLEENNI